MLSCSRFGVLSLFLVASCATLSPAGREVKVSDPAQVTLMQECKDLGPVVESSEYGADQLLVHLKNSAGKIGGNVVMSRLTTEKQMGLLTERKVTRGNVYHCPESIYARLVSSENF